MKKVWQTLLLLCSVIGALCAFAACGESGKRERDASLHQHVLARYGERASTCYYKGTKEHYKCIWCDKLFFDESGEKEATIEELATELLPHTEEIDAAVKPTCTANGYTEGRHCSVCNAVLTAREIIPAGHTVVIDKAVAVTCTTDGKTEGKHCSTCNTVLIKQETIPATGHTVVTDEAVTATCTENGLTAGKHCSVCNTVLVEQKKTPLAEHTETIDEAVAATCTENGLTAGKHCSVCKTVLVEQKVVPATKRHTWTDEKVCDDCGCAYYTEGLEYTLNEEANAYTVSGIGTASGDIVIPSAYLGLPVTLIKNNAFRDCKVITSVTIPKSVTSIGSCAFVRSENLKSITVEDGNPYYHCAGNCLIATAKKALIFGYGNSVIPADGSVTIIWESAFESNKKLTSITIPDSVTRIGYRAFAFTGLTSVVIPESVESIGDMVFVACSALTSAEILGGVTVIVKDTFLNCENLKTVSLPRSVTLIKESAFDYCKSLEVIQFEGSKAKWKAIKKENRWDREASDFIVHCTDGTLDKDGNEIASSVALP